MNFACSKQAYYWLSLGYFAKLGPHFILVPLNIRCRNIIYKQKGPIVLRIARLLTIWNVKLLSGHTLAAGFWRFVLESCQGSHC